MQREEEILYVGDQKRTLFFYEDDIDLLKKLSGHILEQYENYDIFGTDNLKDLNDELILSKPTVIIMALSEENYEGVVDFIRYIRGMNNLAKTPVILLGNRGLLEKKSEELEKWDVSFVPKAVRVPFFMGVLSSALSKAQSVDVTVLKLSKGDHLFNEGDTSDQLFIVKSGLLKIYKKRAGQIFNIATAARFEIIGEMGIIDKSDRSASVVALENSEVYVLNLGNIEDFFSGQPFWLEMILKSVVSRLKEMNDKVLSS